MRSFSAQLEEELPLNVERGVSLDIPSDKSVEENRAYTFTKVLNLDIPIIYLYSDQYPRNINRIKLLFLGIYLLLLFFGFQFLIIKITC